MLNYIRKAGTVDVSVVIRIIDSTDGTPETGVVWNTTGIDLQYRREGAVSTAITEATLATLDAAHADGGFLHIGNGYYRLDLPDAACAINAVGVLIHGIVTGMVVIGCYVQLVTFDPFDTVRMGMTALPNAVANAAGGLPISAVGALNLDSIKTVVDNIHDTDLPAVKADTAAVKLETDNLPAFPAAVGDIPTAAQNADKLLGRAIQGSADGGRTVTSALRRIRNRNAIAAGVLTTYAEDDATPDHTAAVTTAAGNPIISVDPV